MSAPTKLQNRILIRMGAFFFGGTPTRVYSRWSNRVGHRGLHVTVAGLPPSFGLRGAMGTALPAIPAWVNEAGHASGFVERAGTQPSP